jgi:hypothetical protein
MVTSVQLLTDNTKNSTQTSHETGKSRHKVGTRVAGLAQSGQQIVELALLAHAELHQLQATEPGHDRLPQASRRRHDDRERPIRLSATRRYRRAVTATRAAGSLLGETGGVAGSHAG